LDLSFEQKRCSDSGECLSGYVCSAGNTCIPRALALPSDSSGGNDHVRIAEFDQDGGAETCIPGLTRCGGNCTDTATNAQNCGSCERQCVAPALGVAVCSTGACHFECQVGLTACSSACADLSSSATDCGSCGHACPQPANGIGICQAGACTIACKQDHVVCGGECLRSIDAVGCLTCDDGYSECAGQCVNLAADPLNCGSCATRCRDQPNGAAICAGGSCGLSCGGGFTQCADRCVDLSRDTSNCGGCGKVCASSEKESVSCNAGQCASSCPSGLSACKDQCVNIVSDIDNCGRCDKRCKPHQSCVLGVCISCVVGLCFATGD
jgi:hypothetical protein